MTSSVPEPHPGPDLLRTPQSKGTAAVSEYGNFVGLRVSQIYPWIAQDVDDSKETSVDKMLKEILADCVTETPRSAGPRIPLDEAGKTRLFDECLREVIPICNGVTQAKSKIIEAKSCQVRENLEEYSGKQLENELYAHFVIAANTALLFLQELEVKDLRRGNDFICFHVLDPSVLVQDHKGQTSERKPDVIVVSEPDARKAHEGSAVEFGQHEFLLEEATRSKNTKFQWRNIRTFVEFKRHGSKDRMKPPPESYSLQPTPTEKMPSREPGAVSALPTAPASSSANPPPPPVAPVRRSARQQEKSKETGSSDRKRTLEQFSPSTSQSKRLKSSSEQQKGHDAIVQAGGHAAELFATHVGRLHVFGLIIVGDMLYLWRYDREGAIQCSGFNFIQDLPRFLVLLLAMQRFENRDWGLNQDIDPDFGERRPHETTLTGAKDMQITLTLDLSDPDRVTHFGLNGRATNVFPAKISAQSRNLSGREDIVVKVFWPQAERTSEPTILEKVDDIAKHDDDVKEHVPQMLWYQKFEETSTANIRKRLGLDVTPQSSRVLYMIIFRRLSTIRELVGNDFLQAWWATVKCHLALWKNGVHHRDISDSNLMYYRDNEGAIVGVLNDFDLATIKETPTGTQRTGTLPFMALALLEDAEGRRKHLYEHDAESFIWILIWISLQYSNGKPRKDGRPLDEWLGKADTQCRKEKLAFLYSDQLWGLQAGEGHARNWELAKKCIQALKVAWSMSMGPLQPLDVDTAFETLLGDPYSNLSNM